MFRGMRRDRQSLCAEECEKILEKGTSGVLALLGDEGYPYAVPLSYVCTEGKLLFHWARAGHKLDAVRACDKASFCVVDQDRVVPEEYTTYFRSVIVFGRMRILESDAEKRSAIERLAKRYAPCDSDANRAGVIARQWDRLCMVEMDIEHMTGKEAIELVNQKS